jgi:hypothetical protein
MSAVEISFSIHPPPAFSQPPNVNTSPPPSVFPLGTTSSKSASPFEPHYTHLLTSLEEAQVSLNQSLTEWKDAIGDSEKHKEQISKPGMGKAMMMVQGSRETDGRIVPGTFDVEEEEVVEEDEDEDEEEEEASE